MTPQTVVRYLEAGVTERRRHDVVVLWERGLVVGGIGRRLRLSDKTVLDHLRALGIYPLRYGRGVIECHHSPSHLKEIA